MCKKSMMKNVLAVVMAATVAISVTGCKGKKNQDAASSAPSTSLSDSASTAQSETPDTAESEAESKPDSNAASTENKTAESEAASDKAEKPAASLNTNPDNVSTKDGPAKAPVYNTHKTTTGTKTPAQKPAAVTPAATPAEKESQPVYTFTVRHHDATCTTQGYDEHICNEWGGMNYNDNYVAAKGHSWDNGTVTKAATYTETGIKTFKCKDCGETRTEEIPSLDKTYHILQVVAPTCTSEGYTIYECNEVPGLTYKGDFTDKTPHTYDEGVVTKEATIYEKGVKTFTCSACGDTYTEDIPMVEKTWHKGDTVAPTCTEQGYTVYICDQDATLTENRDFVDALDHDWGEGVVTKAATCTEDGEKTFTCSRDGATKTEVIPAVGHKWDDGTVTTPATCEASGVKTYKCQNTGCTETKTEEIAALGHNYDEGVVTKAATCTEDGEKTFTCSRDGATKTEVIPAVGHKWDDGTVTTPATCEASGVKTYKCLNDGCTETKTEEIAALGHNYDDGVVTTEPTYTENGVKTFTCHNCGDTYTESIPALGYTYNETVVAPTCTEDGYTMHECVEDATKSFKDNIVPALGHEYKEVTTPATCKDAGSVDKVCERCNDKQHVRDIPVNEEHQWDEGVITKEPTATEPGIKTYTCTVCNKTKTESIAKVHVHDYTRLGEIVEGPYCETEGKRWMYCSYEGCNERVLKPVPAIGYHDWDTEHTECLKKATCTEPGTMLMHCKRDASHTMTYSYGGTGHIWDEGVITTQPTHDEYGVKTLHCKNCDATMTEKVLPTKYTFTVTVVPPTCTEDGYTMHKCNEDDSFSYKDNIVHSTGHHAEMRVIEPTCKEEGRTEIYCTVCGEVSTVLSTTPKKDHTWDNGVVTTEPTTEHEGVKTYTCTGCGETKTESIARLPASAKVAANPIVAGAEPVVEVPAQEMSAESINAETYVAETPVESAVPAETPAEPAAPVESAETEKSAETSEDSTDTKQEDADMPKETEAEVVIVEGAAE